MKWITGLLFENLAWKALALCIAVLLWALVASEPELSTFARVGLEYKNLPDDLEISSEPVGTITLELRGPSGELRGVDSGIRPAVVIDMSGVQPGERTFTIEDRDVKLARGVHLVRTIPSEVHYTFERTAYRQIPVQVRFTGEGAQGYLVSAVTVDPPRLPIAGPASHVARVAAAITDPVDVSTAVGSAEFHVNAFVNDPFVRFQTSPQVTVDIRMTKK